MKKSNKYILIFSLTFFVLLASNIHFEALAAKTNNKTKRKKKKRKPILKQTHNKRKFDEIKEFYSYDPVTGKWSKIEDFETVEILENRKIKRKEEYIYRDFWAYDYKTNQWYQVDISAFGYKAKESDWNKIFKNFAIDIGTGMGMGQHDMYISGNNIYIAEIGGEGIYKIANKEGISVGPYIGDGKRNFVLGFLQLIKSTQVNNDNDHNDNIERSERIRFAQRVYGFEPVIPFFISAHYTFNKKYRVGFDFELSFNLLEKFSVKLQNKKVEETTPLRRQVPGLKKQGMFVKSPTFVLKPSLYLAYSIYRWDTFNDILLDLLIGPSLYLTDVANFRSIGFWNFRTMLGVRYERRFGNYGRLFTRIGPEFEFGKIIEIASQKRINGDLFSRVIRFNVHIGIGTYFGKDTEIEKAVKKQLKEVRKRKREKRRRLAREAKKKKLKDRYKRLGIRMKNKKKKKK